MFTHIKKSPPKYTHTHTQQQQQSAGTVSWGLEICRMAAREWPPLNFLLPFFFFPFLFLSLSPSSRAISHLRKVVRPGIGKHADSG